MQIAAGSLKLPRLAAAGGTVATNAATPANFEKLRSAGGSSRMACCRYARIAEPSSIRRGRAAGGPGLGAGCVILIDTGTHRPLARLNRSDWPNRIGQARIEPPSPLKKFDNFNIFLEYPFFWVYFVIMESIGSNLLNQKIMARVSVSVRTLRTYTVGEQSPNASIALAAFF